jgi:hypothetical protein
MEVSMKYGLLIILMLFAQMGFSQTMKEIKVKQEMLERVDGLLEKITQTRGYLVNMDPQSACSEIHAMFKVYPKHLEGILGRMNLFDKKVVRLKDESMRHLFVLHRLSLDCKTGEACENLNIGSSNRLLKSMEIELKKHRKVIQKGDTSYENTYSYEYRF